MPYELTTPRPGAAMSIRACDQVWRRSKAKGSTLLLLLAIADCANDEGTHAYPTIATLAEKTRLTQRQIINLVKQLEESGELSVIRPRTRRTGLANYYTLHVGDLNPLGAKISPEKISHEIAARSGEAGYSTTVLVQPSEDSDTGGDAERLWLATLDKLRGRFPRSRMADLEDTRGLRMDGGTLIVAGPARLNELADFIRHDVGQAVRFEG
jgi:hypothetical protein